MNGFRHRWWALILLLSFGPVARAGAPPNVAPVDARDILAPWQQYYDYDPRLAGRTRLQAVQTRGMGTAEA